jgi:hypothetical protein
VLRVLGYVTGADNLKKGCFLFSGIIKALVLGACPFGTDACSGLPALLETLSVLYTYSYSLKRLTWKNSKKEDVTKLNKYANIYLSVGSPWLGLSEADKPASCRRLFYICKTERTVTKCINIHFVTVFLLVYLLFVSILVCNPVLSST